MDLNSAGQYGDFQNEIYLDGLSGVVPTMPMNVAELEARVRAALPPSVLSYVAGGAGDESTQRANVSAFTLDRCVVSGELPLHSAVLSLPAVGDQLVGRCFGGVASTARCGRSVGGTSR